MLFVGVGKVTTKELAVGSPTKVAASSKPVVVDGLQVTVTLAKVHLRRR